MCLDRDGLSNCSPEEEIQFWPPKPILACIPLILMIIKICLLQIYLFIVAVIHYILFLLLSVHWPYMTVLC